MNAIPISPARGRHVDRLICASALAIVFWTQIVYARPRAPGPPYPDSTPILYSESFDEEFYAGSTNDEVVIAGMGTLEQSWSGYALQRLGDVTPFIIPCVDTNGWTNVTSATQGAFRFWIKPYWSSASVTNNDNPGAISTVLELDAVSGGGSAVAWSLQVSADGNTLELISQTDSGPQVVLETSVAWAAGTSHCLVVDWNGTGTALYVDGSVVATGTSLPSIPPSVGELVIGSTLAGTNSAGADIDEFYSFGKPLTALDIAAYYEMTAPEAARGPLHDDWHPHASHHHSEAAADLRPVYDPNIGCAMGGLPYLTNFSAATVSNGTTTVSFSVAGGTNGVFYDVYYLTNLNAFLNQSTWTWAGEVLACNAYTYTNQPADRAFYFITAPILLGVRAWGDNSYGECNVPLDLTNVAAVAAGGFFSLALKNDGTIVAWGDNTHEQTNVPPITNASGIAAGQYHGLALLSNGCVLSWGSYFDGSSYYAVTNSYPGISGPPTSNVMAIAAGIGHDLALLSNGTVISWGLTNIYPMTSNALAYQSNLTGVAAIACGWNHNVVLLSNGTVKAWGMSTNRQGWDFTNAPAGTNFVGIAANALHTVAFRSDGSAATWGNSEKRETNILAGLADIVAVAAGSDQSLALGFDGTFTAWGVSNFNAATVPADLFGVKAMSAGFTHNLVIASSTLPPFQTVPPAGFAPYGGSFTFSVTGVYVANVQYQWQLNGTNLTGQTNTSLTLTGVSSSDNGNYDVVISNANGTVTSFAASFAMALPPVINSTTPLATTNWINYTPTLSVVATAVGQLDFPLSYQWRLNGTDISGMTNSYYTIPGLVLDATSSTFPTNDGNYTVVVSNAQGSASATWTELLALPGMVEVWGSDTNGECDRPVTLTNVAAIAAGDYHSVALTDSGMILQWGEYWDGSAFYSVTNTNYVSLPPTSNVVAVAASLGHDLALLADGSVTNWGLTNSFTNSTPTNLGSAKAIAAGWYHNVALLTNGSVSAWGSNSNGQTTVPNDLTNVNAATAIAAGQLFSLALRTNGTVEGWGDNSYGQTNVPVSVSNVVAIAAGGQHCLALTSSGCVVAWGNNGSGQTNVPLSATSNIMQIAAGAGHSVALKNDGTLVEWGNNGAGQATVPLSESITVTDTNASPPTFQLNPPIVIKLIAAGGNHTMAAIFSQLVQYPVDVSKDLLLIYNSNSTDSSNVCAYYLANRPMVSNANVLSINCSTNEQIDLLDFTNDIAQPIQAWLSANPTKRPQYVILFQDIPSRNSLYNEQPSVQYEIHTACAPGWSPFVSSINMNGNIGTNSNASDGTNDTIAYINKLTNMAGANQTLFISASAMGYGNTNWYFDGGLFDSSLATDAQNSVLNADPSAMIIHTTTNHIYAGTNVAGYYSRGWDGGLGTGPGLGYSFATNGQVIFTNNSGWYAMATVDSYNGTRVTIQSSFLTWFATNAFGGTNYSNTPVGAITHVDEPSAAADDTYDYYGSWAAGKCFAICAWAGQQGNDGPRSGYTDLWFQAVGDPFVKK